MKHTKFITLTVGMFFALSSFGIRCGSILVIDIQLYVNKKVQMLYQSKTEYKGCF